MNRFLDHTNHTQFSSTLTISGSKSESNRLLLLQKIFPNLKLLNLSDSDDTVHFQHALQSENSTIDVGHAGTAMRFLTAFFATNNGKETIITGSKRMTERPIEVLVDALKAMGAEIEFLEKKGYPPLQIKGKKIFGKEITIPSSVSSQYISALLLISPLFETDFQLKLIGEITSKPYIEMTLSLLHQMGLKSTFQNNIINIPKQLIDFKKKQTITIESDWSSASYFYSLVALSNVGSKITLNYFNKNSLQGDSILANIYEKFGVKTSFLEHSIQLEKVNSEIFEPILELDLIKSPDIAQTIAVTSLALKNDLTIRGLHTLKIKETDRLNALKIELEKLGAIVKIDEESISFISPKKINQNIAIDTYNDHRMAMAFAPLSLLVPITINDSEVVTKSYKNFWTDFQSVFKS